MSAAGGGPVPASTRTIESVWSIHRARTSTRSRLTWSRSIRDRVGRRRVVGSMSMRSSSRSLAGSPRSQSSSPTVGHGVARTSVMSPTRSTMTTSCGSWMAAAAVVTVVPDPPLAAQSTVMWLSLLIVRRRGRRAGQGGERCGGQRHACGRLRRCRGVRRLDAQRVAPIVIGVSAQTLTSPGNSVEFDACEHFVFDAGLDGGVTPDLELARCRIRMEQDESRSGASLASDEPPLSCRVEPASAQSDPFAEVSEEGAQVCPLNRSACDEGRWFRLCEQRRPSRCRGPRRRGDARVASWPTR